MPSSPAPRARARWSRYMHRPDRWVLALYVVTVLAIVVVEGATVIDNNFAVFRASFRHLALGHDLYAAYPGEHSDRFKYSPTFAFLFAPFSLLPTLAGLALWNGLNVLLLCYAIRQLLPRGGATLVLALVYLEVVRTTQRAQSNALVTALIVLGFVWIERRRSLAAALAIAVGVFVKLFPAAALLLAVFDRRRWRTWLLFGSVLLAGFALPLVVTSPARLAGQYASWRAIEAADALADAGGGAAGLYGGVMYQIRLWLGVAWPNWPIQLAGGLVLVAPVARVHCWSDAGFRMRMLCSLLVFLVLFNPQVESPSFVIAVTGIAIWFVRSDRTRLDVALMALTMLVVSVSSTELTPHWLQDDLFVRYRLKTVPCLLVWLVMQAELLGLRSRSAPEGAEIHEPDRARA